MAKWPSGQATAFFFSIHTFDSSQVPWSFRIRKLTVMVVNATPFCLVPGIILTPFFLLLWQSIQLIHQALLLRQRLFSAHCQEMGQGLSTLSAPCCNSRCGI